MSKFLLSAFSSLSYVLKSHLFCSDQGASPTSNNEDLVLLDSITDNLPLQSVFPDNMRMEALKMLGSLSLILILFGVCVWAFKKFVKSQNSAFNRSSAIKILDRRALNPKTCIYIIRVVNKTLVIAESGAGEAVTLLSEFPLDTDILSLLEPDQKKGSTSAEFLSKNLKKFQQNKLEETHTDQ